MQSIEYTDDRNLIEHCHPFKEHSPSKHFLMVVVGVLVWVGTYVAVMHATGYTSMAAEASTEAMYTRRNMAGVAGFVCGLYFGLMWTRAIGGPFLTIFYPMTFIVLIPDSVHALFQPAPEHIFTTAEFIGNPVMAWDIFHIAIPLFIGILLPIITFLNWMSEAEREEWHKRHLRIAGLLNNQPRILQNSTICRF